jgi:hypothetical protein
MKKLLIIAFNIFFAAAQSSVNSDARMIWDRVVNNIVKHDLEALSNHIVNTGLFFPDFTGLRFPLFHVN